MKIDKSNIIQNIISTMWLLVVLALVLFGLWGMAFEPGVPLYKRIGGAICSGLILFGWLSIGISQQIRDWKATFRDTNRPLS